MSWQEKAFECDEWAARLKGTKEAQLDKRLFLGTSFQTGDPMLLDDAIGEEHIWSIGGSGSGKRVPND